MGNIDSRLARMQALMTYGVVSEAQDNGGSLEHHKVAADGRAYAIIRECSHYYIKTAPKDKELVAEAYDYIGGWNNHKDYEYNSYQNALKQFDLKMMSINEAYGVKGGAVSLDPDKKKDFVIEGTEEMRSELARQRQIMENTERIINEGSFVGVDDPEGVEGNSDENAPYTEKGEAKLDKDLKDKEDNPEDAGNPFGEEKKTEEYKDVDVEDSVASEHPKGGEAVMVKEACEKCGCKDGSCNCVNEEDEFSEEDFEVEDETDNADGEPEAEEEETVDTEEETEEVPAEDEPNEEEADSLDDLDDRISELEAEIAELKELISSDEPENLDDKPVDVDAETNLDAEIEGGPDAEEDNEAADEKEVEDTLEDVGDIDDISESRKAFLNQIVESVTKQIKEDKTILHDFGKHPGYQKKPMTTPPAQDEEPFGKEIGDGKPFDKFVNVITDGILAELKKKV